MEWVTMGAFALAVSLDGFGVGAAYGLRNIAIPWLSLTVICLVSMIVVAFSMILGKGIALYLSPHVADFVGAFVLAVMGLGIIVGAMIPPPHETASNDCTVFSFKLRPFGIIVQIMREPGHADFDASGEISGKEACFLGMALAMDVMAAGLGMAMTGYNIAITTVMVGLAKFLMIRAGLNLGKTVADGFLRKSATITAGVILVVLGLWQLL